MNPDQNPQLTNLDVPLRSLPFWRIKNISDNYHLNNWEFQHRWWTKPYSSINQSNNLDKDSKFYTTFHDMVRLTKLNTHMLSCANHDPMLIECIGRYLNKSLKIFNAKHSFDPRVAHEGLHMAMYAWNCAPVAGTDISRCLMVTGRKWRFPLDYSTGAHLE